MSSDPTATPDPMDADLPWIARPDAMETADRLGLLAPDPMDEAANTEPLRRRRDVGQWVSTSDAKRIRDEAVTAERERHETVLSIEDAGEEAVLSLDFYRCPNTGEWVYQWADERRVLVDATRLRELLAVVDPRNPEYDPWSAEVEDAWDEIRRLLAADAKEADQP